MENVIVTREFLIQGRSGSGGWTRAQMESLGLPWPIRSGWMDAIAGAQISTEAAQLFLTSGKAKRAPKTGNIDARSLFTEAPSRISG